MAPREVPEPPHEWYILVHQLPPTPLYLRAKIRNRLTRVGAIGLKNSVYVLPLREDCLEDLQWIAGEAVAGGGSAYVCRASFLAGATNDALVAAFRAHAERAIRPLAREATGLLARHRAASRSAAAPIDAAVRRLSRKFEQAASADFFSSAAGREVTVMLHALEPGARSGKKAPAGKFVGRTWVTRPGPKTDRMASGWLIRRFIDPAARFRFLDPSREAKRPGEVTFDMVGGDFTHEAGGCTFETLAVKFHLNGDPALRAIGEIVHDLDLKDKRFGRPDAAGIRLLVDGIVKSAAGDDERMQRGAALFDDMYASLSGAKPASTDRRPRTARRRKPAR